MGGTGSVLRAKTRSIEEEIAAKRGRAHTMQEPRSQTEIEYEPLTPQPPKRPPSFGATKRNRSQTDLSKCEELTPVPSDGSLPAPETTPRRAARRPNLQRETQATEGAQGEVPERVVRLISQALTDMFFLGSAMFASMQLVSTSFSEERFAEGDVVVREGDAGDRMFVIATGRVKFFKTKQGSEIFLGEAGEGDVVGELALFYGGKRAATVVAGKGGVRAWSIRREQFRTLAAVDANARSLTQRAVTLRSNPALSKLSRRQIYTLARAMKALALRPGEAIDHLDDDALVLVQDGSLRVTGTRRGKPLRGTDLHAALFPDRPQLVSIEDDALVCDASVLVGLHHLLLHGTDDADKRKTSHVAVRFVAGEGGCRAHAVTTNNLKAHLGANIAKLVCGIDAPRASTDPESPLAASYVSLDDAPRSPNGRQRAESMDDATLCRSDFLIEKLLGQGSYGFVVRAVLSSNSKKRAGRPITKTRHDGRVALKLMSKQQVLAKRQVQHVLDERRLLSRLEHPNIMRLFASFQDDSCLYLVTELIDGPDLWSVIYEPPAVGYSEGRLRDANDALLQLYAACVVQALAHIHHHGVVYRDLKPENLMVSPSGYLKVVDFGFAKQLPFYTTVSADDATTKASTTNLVAHFKTYTLCGTAEYLAPEMIACTGHDWCTDTWAAACVFHELAVGMTPFIERHGETDDAVMRRIMNTRKQALIPPFRLARRKFIASLVVDCLKYDPTERLGAEELLQHNAFENLDWDKFVRQGYVPDWTPPQTELPKGETLDLHLPAFEGDHACFDLFGDDDDGGGGADESSSSSS
ncbi:hypothetical protein CTAYLR_008969 [Chrysophaeum taylorii]|uniref:cGMP-dependent protein kinase n=1 Tax=Chrysophaeum taylorii TaxID=2483200 RepID=A0AAD7UJE9_9STRA|nr:hypothetical protein CTAYLR_008969 [Chrysophaeum taylorii]